MQFEKCRLYKDFLYIIVSINYYDFCKKQLLILYENGKIYPVRDINHIYIVLEKRIQIE